jgi:hypothetical protein
MHYNLFPSADISATTLPGVSSGQAIQIMDKICRETLPPQFGFGWTELSLQQILAGLKFGFGLKNMVCHIFLAESEATRPAERGRRSKSPEGLSGFEDLNAPKRSVGRSPFKPQTALLHRRGHPWVRNGSGVARQDTGVILSEPGFAYAKEEGETALGLDGQKVFSPKTILRAGIFEGKADRRQQQKRDSPKLLKIRML